MIKKRIIPTLTYKNTGLVKSTHFDNYRFIGDPIQAINVNNIRDVDELLFVDISTMHERPNMSLISEIMENAFMPITIGGGIRTTDDIRKLLRVGADKVCLSSIAIENETFVRTAIDQFGGQAIVICIDYLKKDNQYKLVTNPNFQIHEVDIFKYIETMDKFGVSEFILTSIDQDGTMTGYDLEFAKQIEKKTDAGIIINGGASTYEDMYLAFSQTKAIAVAAASMFQYTEQTPIEARGYLRSRGIATRA